MLTYAEKWREYALKYNFWVYMDLEWRLIAAAHGVTEGVGMLIPGTNIFMLEHPLLPMPLRPVRLVNIGD